VSLKGIHGGIKMKNLILKNGDTVTIRKACKSDGRPMLEFMNAVSRETEFLTFGEGEFDMTVEQEESFIDNISKQSNALLIIAELQGRIVGNLFYSGGARKRIAHTGEFGVSVLKEFWGQGIGKELIKYLIEFCKQSRIIRKINLKVRSDNYSAIHVYKKLGFIEEGVITRDLLIRGDFYDSILMGLSVN
jgi:RimJ/RimL family protein N-acetyltransferase